MNDNLLKMFRHTAGVDVENGAAIPRRFTKAQLAYYERLGEGLYYSASSSSCVELAFITDAPVVQVDFKADRYKRPFAVWDIYEDNMLCQQLRIDGCMPAGSISYRRQKSEASQITICLPYSCRVGVTNVDAGNWRPVAPASGLRYLALGDSITLGSDSGSASLNYVRLVARHFQSDVLNCGVGGFWYDAASLDPDLGFMPDFITVAYGANDQGHWTLSETQQHIDAYYDRLIRLFPHTAIHLISPVWRSDLNTLPQLKANYEAITQMIYDKAAEYHLHYIDGMTLMPHLPIFMDDRRLHPTSTGFLQYAANLIPQLNQMKPIVE